MVCNIEVVLLRNYHKMQSYLVIIVFSFFFIFYFYGITDISSLFSLFHKSHPNLVHILSLIYLFSFQFRTAEQQLLHYSDQRGSNHELLELPFSCS